MHATKLSHNPEFFYTTVIYGSSESYDRIRDPRETINRAMKKQFETSYI